MEDMEIMDTARFRTLKVVTEDMEEELNSMAHDDSSNSPSSSLQEEILASNETRQKVVATKQFIENHYKSQMKNMQERKQRYLFFSTKKIIAVQILSF